MINLKDLTYDDLKKLVEDMGESGFRAGQIFAWLHKGVSSIDEMTNLSMGLRKRLSETAFVSCPKIRLKRTSKLDGTVKYLFGLADGNCIETVVMKYNHGLSVCVSTQVGCRMGCGFCASTIGGKQRDLTPGEILDQVIFASADMGQRISNIVLMGIGEPFDNYDNVMVFLKNVTDPKGINIGWRHISLSTCGIVPKIKELADMHTQLNLCISLHAPNDEIRNQIMPVNHKYGVSELMKAAEYYIKKTNRRITFEYSLIKGVNDKKEHAEELAGLLSGLLCHVNLIPVNHVKERSFEKSSSVEKFKEVLEKRGINATVRRELGSDISASCGQLRRKHDGEGKRASEPSDSFS